MNDPAVPNPAPDPTPAPRRKNRWRRRFILLGAFVASLGALLALLPAILSLSNFKAPIERALSESLGVPVTLSSHRLSWASGATIEGLTVAQPAGFPADRPVLSLRRANLAIDWLRLMAGDIDVTGEVSGLRMLVYETKDGRVNLAQLGDASTHTSRSRDGESHVSVGASTSLQRLRADLVLRDIDIDVVHEERGVLESIRNLEGRIDKRLGDSDFKMQLSAELAGPVPGKAPGKLQIDADVDGSLQRPLEFQVTSAGFDFARYRPLVDAALGAGALSTLDGVLDGTVKARVENLDTVFVTGALTVNEPALGGTLVQGMNVQGKRWVLNPNVKLVAAKDGAPARADLAGFGLDLGLAKIRGVPAAAAAAAFADTELAGAETFALDFEVDLQALGRLGGPMPAMLAAQPGTLSGRATLAVPAAGFADVDVMKLLTEALVVDADVVVPSLDLGNGIALGALSLQTSLARGAAKAVLAPGATLNGGGASLAVTCDLRQPGWPATVKLGVTEGRLAAGAVQLLQYAVPVFAGLAAQQNVQLDGRGTLAMEFQGPATPTGGESWLQWLDHWTGQGKVALAEGSVMPAPAFAGLMQWLDPDRGGRLAFDAIDTDFTLRTGAVNTGLVKLDGKAKKIQIQGQTRLDGTLDHRIDMLGLLAGHKDGEKVLAYLKGQALNASVAGTLSTPQVGLPDMQKLVTDALKANAEAEVKKQADNLIQKGLEGLFKRRN